MGDFQGKRVLITGAARGIGRQLALDFAAEGARVVVNYNQSSGPAGELVAEITGAGGSAIALKADIGQSEDVQRMFGEVDAALGGLDILLNNAGINRDVPFLEMSEDDWDSVIAANLKGPFLCCQAAARMMMREPQDGGRIINLSAVTSLVGRENAANYSASKGGLNALTRALAVELGPTITVNAIALGFFDSPLVRDLYSTEQIDAVASKLPTGRIGTFSEVSAMVRYLACEAAGYVTGQVINLDGGQLSRMP